MSDVSNASPEKPLIGGKTLDEWDTEWVRVKGGFKVDHPQLRHQVGLYRAMSGRIVEVLGRATEHANGGLAKRLADFRRESSSAREHTAGWFIHQNQSNLYLEVLITGRDRKAGDIAKKLVGPMEVRHKPRQNRRFAAPKVKRKAPRNV